MAQVYKSPLEQSNALAPESTRSKWNRYFKHIGDGNPRTVDKYNKLIEEIESELPFENEQEHQKWLDLGASWKGEDEWPQLTESIIARKEKPTVGEDLDNYYNNEFFKQANGDRNAFIEHNINRFGVPRGSNRNKEVEHYGQVFDRLNKGGK